MLASGRRRSRSVCCARSAIAGNIASVRLISSSIPTSITSRCVVLLIFSSLLDSYTMKGVSHRHEPQPHGADKYRLRIGLIREIYARWTSPRSIPPAQALPTHDRARDRSGCGEIGRASCRERVCVGVDFGGGRIIKKKKIKNSDSARKQQH